MAKKTSKAVSPAPKNTRAKPIQDKAVKPTPQKKNKKAGNTKDIPLQLQKEDTPSEEKKTGPPEVKKVPKKSASKKTAPAKAKKEMVKPATKKKSPAVPKKARRALPNKAASGSTGSDLQKPSLRSVYANKTNTLMPLGFGSDFKTHKTVVIFSDLSTGQVYTTALSAWNRLKLREVKEINPQI